MRVIGIGIPEKDSSRFLRFFHQPWRRITIIAICLHMIPRFRLTDNQNKYTTRRFNMQPLQLLQPGFSLRFCLAVRFILL